MSNLVSQFFDDYNHVLEILIPELKAMPKVLAAWEGGSASTGNKDQYSDLDLCLFTEEAPETVFEKIESVLQKSSGIHHKWNVNNTVWPGLNQKMYVLKNSPPYFFIDAGIFHTSSEELMLSFLEVERHGTALVHFDKTNKIKTLHTDVQKLNERKKKRLQEISEAFPFYKILVQKEIARNRHIDAFAFFQNGMLRPLVEVLGMIHRPFQYDFGFRYIHRSFPQNLQNQIESLCYLKDLEDLKRKVQEVDAALEKALPEARKLLP